MKSVKSKLIVYLSVLISVACISIIVPFALNAYKEFKNNTVELMTELARQGVKNVELELQRTLGVLDNIAISKEMTNPSYSFEEKAALLAKYSDLNGFLRMTIIDTSGDAWISNGTTNQFPDRDYFLEAMKGNRYVSDPMVSRNDGKQVVVFSVPLRENNNIVGVITATFDLALLSKITNEINFGQSGMALMVTQNDDLIAHPDQALVDSGFNGIEKAKTDPSFQSLAAAEQGMLKGTAGSAEYSYNGLKKLMVYVEPIKITNWFLAVTAPVEQIFEEIDKTLNFAIILVVVFVFISCCIATILGNTYANPIKHLNKMVLLLGKGELAFDVSPKVVKVSKRRDEFGVIATSLLHLKQVFQDTLSKVNTKFTDVETRVNVVHGSLQDVNANISVISSITEELSAGMEETSSLTTKINSNFLDVNSSIDEIATTAGDGKQTAEEINVRVIKLKNSFVESQKEVEQKLNQFNSTLSVALEESKAVEQINELVTAIISIASQTNLLALNASIEAARAGEAGKGFSVVAEEIKKLAENSNQTASQIQNIIKIVIDSVENLANNANSLMDFVSNTIGGDYKNMLDTMNYYSNDADTLAKLVMNFSHSIDILRKSTTQIIHAMSEIENAAEQGANGTYDIATRNSEIMKQTENVTNQMDESLTYINYLNEVVKIFKF